MVRVRNEEEFLLPSLESIVDEVDQIVVVDNMSEDATGQLARQFQSRHPSRVKVLEYPHRIALPGSETSKLAGSRRGRRSPNNLAVFYDWCVAACSGPYILKWDGDMVATGEFARSLREFRTRADVQSLWFSGVNVHPDLVHSLSDSDFSRRIADSEARLFPKRLASHNLEPGIYESLRTPYKHGRFAMEWERPTYLHLKLCKREPLQNWSTEYRTGPDSWDLPRGDRLSPDMAAAVERFGLCSHPRQRGSETPPEDGRS
jgi:glycosyltransferase involved in cell wall biosynthesis